jgi:hypothetical protein
VTGSNGSILIAYSYYTGKEKGKEMGTRQEQERG